MCSPTAGRWSWTPRRCTPRWWVWPTRSTPTPGERFPGPDRRDVADLLRWLGDGHFVLLGYQRCPVRDGRASVDQSSRLGVLRLRDEVLPQLTDNDDLLVLAQATMPSYLRYGAYPYIVVVREHARGRPPSSIASSACSRSRR